MNNLHYSLFLGCFIPARLPHIESITLKVLNILGVQTTNLENASCCPDPVSSTFANRFAWHALAARNLSLAEFEKRDLLTFCSGCNLTLSSVNKELKENIELRNSVNDSLSSIDRNYSGDINVRSILWLLYSKIGVSEIKKHVKRPLKNLRVGIHLGCHIREDLEEYDDPSNPQSMKELVSAIGAENVSYKSESLCCASFARFIHESKSLSQVDEKLFDMQNAQIDCLVTICPTCFLQYDVGQLEVNIKLKKNYNIPVLYYSQLLGLAMGLTPQEVGLNFHRIKAKRVIEKLNI